MENEPVNITDENEKPVVSIITACLNAEDTIEQTIQSVIDQTYPKIEYVIIDGNSTDGTLDIIRKYKDHITKWISEPDTGVYDGMNKGIAHSTGDILYFLNSGDHLYNNGIIEEVVNKFADGDTVAVYGNVEVVNEHSKKTVVRGTRVTHNNLLYRRVCHQALFVKRELFEEFGDFVASLKYSADHEFIVKAIKKYPDRFLYVNETIARYQDGGMSCKMMEKTKMDDLKIISSNYNIVQFLFGAVVCAYVILKYKIPQILKMKSAHIDNERMQ